eukprot:2374386-Rhodomonas_salina.3
MRLRGTWHREKRGSRGVSESHLRRRKVVETAAEKGGRKLVRYALSKEQELNGGTGCCFEAEESGGRCIGARSQSFVYDLTSCNPELNLL